VIKMIAMGRTWTAERVEQLKSRFDAGLSCEEIAREIGVSRNAVIGKLNRLRLSRFNTATPRQRQPKPMAPFTQHQILKALRAGPRAAEELPIHNGSRCSLVELSEGKCRWPISDPGAEDFGFCGGQSVEGLPYCAAHARIAYQPAAGQRATRR
jgi:GcrA cell cycle regulator